MLHASGTSWFFLSTLSKQLDESLKEELEMVEQLLPPLPEALSPRNTHGEDIEQLERFIEIWRADGTLLYRSRTLGGGTLGNTPDTTSLRHAVRTYSHRYAEDAWLRVAEKLHSFSTSDAVIRLGISEEGYFSHLHDFLLVLLIGIPVGLLLVSISAYMMVMSALKPIDNMAATAMRIRARDLAERIPVQNKEDELGHLALAFNDLLSRVQKSFEELKRFTSDASHELRTPLTAMRSVGEVGLQTGRTLEEYREVIGSMLEETNRLTQLVDSLLLLARADTGSYRLHHEDVDLLTFARETCGIVAILAEEKHQYMSVEGKHVVVTADKGLLRQAMLNLLDNAIKFTPEGGRIMIRTGTEHNREGFVDVQDSGPGILASEHELIFERFYRSHQEGTSGAGLGLAIARWAVEVNRGRISVSNREPSGAAFRIHLPLAAHRNHIAT